MLLSLNARLQLGDFFPDLVDFLLDREFIEARKGQAQQQADAAIEYVEGIAKSTVYSLRRPFDSSRIWNAPMRGHWLTRPNRADFFGRVVTYGKHEIHFWGASLGKLVPILAAQPRCGQVRDLQLL